MNRLYDYIAFVCFQRDTAEKYMRGIHGKIGKLAWLGGSIGVSLNRSLLRKYGASVRTIIFKNTTIIYTVRGNLVFVHRVKPGNNIK